MNTFHLVYLIEVAIILNFALRELNLKDLNNLINGAKNDAEDSIRLSNDVYCKDRYNKLVALIQGKRKCKDSDSSIIIVWNSRFLCNLYNWVRSGYAYHISGFSIILNIVILFYITISNNNTVWVFYTFLALITATIIHSLFLIFFTDNIKKYLAGKGEEDGEVVKLFKDLKKCIEYKKIKDTQYITQDNKK